VERGPIGNLRVTLADRDHGGTDSSVLTLAAPFQPCSEPIRIARVWGNDVAGGRPLEPFASMDPTAVLPVIAGPNGGRPIGA
jgi:hypothetical protein